NKQTMQMVGETKKDTEVRQVNPPSVEPIVEASSAVRFAPKHQSAPSGVVTVMEKSVPLSPVEERPTPTAPAERPMPRAPRERMPLNVGVLREKPRVEVDDDVFVSLPPKKEPIPQNIVMEHIVDSAVKPQTEELSEKEIPYRYIGEVFRSYILVESGDCLYLVDKHAAHERMIFERLLKENAERDRARQQMLIPERISLSPDEMSFAMEHREEFEKVGFEIDSFGERKIALRSRPVCIAHESAADAFNEILNDWMRGGTAEWTERENRALKTVACKAAIKAGDLNDSKELRALVSKLIRDDEVHQCPHGRPVMIAYEKKTIEKSFKRI
ncbi:MAG: hypothetical protein IJN82_03885, partial [Clostridia bacterium]|nr:hypothetical protein [Clostridia bacterium]